jgi:hypothetical protein
MKQSIDRNDAALAAAFFHRTESPKASAAPFGGVFASIAIPLSTTVWLSGELAAETTALRLLDTDSDVSGGRTAIRFRARGALGLSQTF